MLDMKRIRSDFETVAQKLANRGVAQKTLLELQELYENGPILERIEKALMYSQRSRYRDFETTLDILFEGMNAETLRDDLLRMEVLRYRRLPYRQENTTGNLV